MTGLQFVGLKATTIKSYKQALRRFFQYLEDEELPLPRIFRELDSYLSQFLEHMWLDDQPMAYAGHLLSALRRFMPESRWKVPRAKQYYSNWATSHVARQATPMPPEVIMAFAGLAISTHQAPLAALLLLGFLAFLRTGEMVSLHATKIHADPNLGRVLLALPSTKTSRHAEETVCVSDPLVAHLVASVLPQLTTPLVWAGSARSFRAVLAEFSTFFELDSFQFSAYSIRRGGASFAFAQGASLDELLIKGRWQSQRTARLYLDTGRAALIQTRFNPRQVKYLHHYGSKLKGFCEQLRRRRTS